MRHHYEVKLRGRAILPDGRMPTTIWVVLRHLSQSQRARIRQPLSHDELTFHLSSRLIPTPLYTPASMAGHATRKTFYEYSLYDS